MSRIFKSNRKYYLLEDNYHVHFIFALKTDRPYIKAYGRKYFLSDEKIEELRSVMKMEGDK